MSAKSKKNKRSKDDSSLKLIKDIFESKGISEREVEAFADINHPLFSFKYLQDNSIKDCTDAKFFYNFLFRLKKLSELGWAEIRKSHKHSFGMEPLTQTQIVPDTKLLPDFITPDVELHVFRSSGDNRTFVGFQKSKIFYIFYIEAAFGDICTH